MDTPSNIFANYHVFECYLFSEDHSVTGLHLVLVNKHVWVWILWLNAIFQLKTGKIHAVCT